MTQTELMIKLWGYAVEGHGDISIRASERGYARAMRDWDDSSILGNTLLNNEKPPNWFALWWVGEHVRRHGKA